MFTKKKKKEKTNICIWKIGLDFNFILIGVCEIVSHAPKWRETTRDLPSQYFETVIHIYNSIRFYFSRNKYEMLLEFIIFHSEFRLNLFSCKLSRHSSAIILFTRRNKNKIHGRRIEKATTTKNHTRNSNSKWSAKCCLDCWVAYWVSWEAERTRIMYTNRWSQQRAESLAPVLGTHGAIRWRYNTPLPPPPPPSQQTKYIFIGHINLYLSTVVLSCVCHASVAFCVY